MINIYVDPSGLKRAATKIDKLIKSISEAESKTNQVIPQKSKRYFEYACDQGITDWYESYDPIYYGRTMSLMKVYEIQPKNEMVNINLDSSRISGHRVGGDYIY